MPPTDINARIAKEVMGWERFVCNGGDVVWRGMPPECWPFLEEDSLPDFEHSLDDCALAEDEIEKRGLMIEYEKALILNSSCPGTPWVWKLRAYLIRLTPAQRCAAMLAAIEAKP